MKFNKLSWCLVGLVFAASILANLSYAQAQKTTSPQPVNVVNTPTVTISNSSLPVNGSVTVNNSSIPVSGNVQVSNLPLDGNGNLKTAAAPVLPIQYEFKVLAFHICIAGDAGICQGTYPEQAGDPILTAMSTSGWELASVVMAAVPNGTGNGSQFGLAYTFRRPLQ